MAPLLAKLRLMAADRLVSLLLLLQTEGRTTALELSVRLGVSLRTARRDLRALQRAGVPLLTEPGRGGGVQLHPRYHTGLTGLSGREAEMLVALSAPELARETGAQMALTSARRKLRTAASAGARERVHVDPSRWFRRREEAPALAALFSAVFAERRLSVRYRRYGGRPRRYRIDPLGLVFKDGAWYLVARCEAALRTFRVSRIEDVSEGGGTFRPPPEFDLADYWSGWVEEFEQSRPRIRVSVRVHASALAELAAQAVEHLERSDDRRGKSDWSEESLIFETLDYAKTAILACGGDVEVVSPKGLRTAVAKAARLAAARYDERASAHRVRAAH